MGRANGTGGGGSAPRWDWELEPQESFHFGTNLWGRTHLDESATGRDRHNAL